MYGNEAREREGAISMFRRYRGICTYNGQVSIVSGQTSIHRCLNQSQPRRGKGTLGKCAQVECTLHGPLLRSRASNVPGSAGVQSVNFPFEAPGHCYEISHFNKKALSSSEM